MSLLFVFLTFILIIAVVVVGGVVVNYTGGSRDRRAVREAEAEASENKARLNIAMRGLRAIANGSGAPVLDASDTLDQIERTYTKELN